MSFHTDGEHLGPKGQHRVVRTSEVLIPPHATICRRSPRNPDRQQSNYHDLFDSHTVFCDVFNTDAGIAMIGPPLLNLESTFLEATYTIDGQVFPVSTFPLNRAQRTQITAMHADSLRIDFGEYNVEAAVRSPMNSLFRGRNVLVAMQRNNPLRWIEEWARLYVAVNKVDALILYDLRSTDYTLTELREVLVAIPGLECSVIVHWPFKYGVKPKFAGDPWDSDFGQYVAWEHAYRRFLQEARAVTVSDVDEVFLAQDGRSIFDHAAESATGVVRFRQRFIEPVVHRAPTSGKDTSYSDYSLFEPARALSTPKYAAILERLHHGHQLLVHSIAGDRTAETDQIIGRQFEAMKLAWDRGNFDRKHPDKPFDPTTNLVVDDVLMHAVRRSADARKNPPEQGFERS
jgi:hypothetical protein